MALRKLGQPAIIRETVTIRARGGNELTIGTGDTVEVSVQGNTIRAIIQKFGRETITVQSLAIVYLPRSAWPIGTMIKLLPGAFISVVPPATLQAEKEAEERRKAQARADDEKRLADQIERMRQTVDAYDRQHGKAMGNVGTQYGNAKLMLRCLKNETVANLNRDLQRASGGEWHKEWQGLVDQEVSRRGMIIPKANANAPAIEID